MKINDEGTSNAAHWHERAMKAEARLAEAENQRDYWEAQAKRTSVENVRAARLSRSVTAPE